MSRIVWRMSVAVLLLATAAHAKQYIYEVKPLPEGLATCRFELWVPANIGKNDRIRAVLCSVDYQAGTILYEDNRWRNLAVKLNCVQLRYDMAVKRQAGVHKLPMDKKATNLIKAALIHFARQAEHPELAHSGLVLTGLSQSGRQCSYFARHMPERIIAAVPFHGIDHSSDEDDSRIWSIPFLVPLGENDQFGISPPAYSYVLNARSHHALWAALIQPELPHHLMGNQDLILMWVEQIIKQRVPEKIPRNRPVKLRAIKEKTGWLGVLRTPTGEIAYSSSIYPYGKLPDGIKPGKTHWLPNEQVARAWARYCLAGGIGGYEGREEIAAIAERVSETVVLDGKLDDWPKLSNQLQWPAQILPNGLNWHGPADASARFGISYDDQFLYLAFDVTDNQNIHRGNAPWEQDGLEIRIDARPAFVRAANRGRGEFSDLLLVAISPAPSANNTYVFNRAELPAQLKAVSVTAATGFTAEIAVPLNYLEEKQGESWQRFRLNIAIDDSDDDGFSQLWWRPDWRTRPNYFGSGTVQRK